MSEDQIKAKLDTLADFQAMAQAMELEKQQLLDAAIPAEVKERMAEIEAEFSGKLDAAKVNIDALTEEVKAAVVSNGASVKGAFLHAVWAKGRVSWDDKGLAGYMVAHPEINAFRREGSPSVSIRSVK